MITTDGNGNLTTTSINFANGKIRAISFFSATGTGSAQTLSHNLGVAPDVVVLQYAGNFGGPPSHPAYWYNATSTQVTCVADSGFFYWAVALKLS